jgi:PhzF family phenazine biosynthesis protein
MTSGVHGGELLRLTAFSETPEGGNPAGVWFGDELPSADAMRSIAADVGYSETAFSAPLSRGVWMTRYYSPEAEVSFCGHATVATGVALGDRFGSGSYLLQTAVGPVPVEVADRAGRFVASLTSVEPEVVPLREDLKTMVLDALGWSDGDLDAAIPTGLAYAGAWHVVLPIGSRATLSRLDYDFGSLKETMLRHDLTTVQLVTQVGEAEYDARDPFPVGGVVEDPATGAAAAAFGAHLRHHGRMSPPFDIIINQGEDMGRPSVIQVHVPASGGVVVSGTAVPVA